MKRARAEGMKRNKQAKARGGKGAGGSGKKEGSRRVNKKGQEKAHSAAEKEAYRKKVLANHEHVLAAHKTKMIPREFELAPHKQQIVDAYDGSLNRQGRQAQRESAAGRRQEDPPPGRRGLPLPPPAPGVFQRGRLRHRAPHPEHIRQVLEELL